MTPTLQRVLYIDDEMDILRIAKFALKNTAGLEVETHTNGNDAVSLALSFKPDIILLDVMMPEIDGPTTFRTLRAVSELNHIPIIFMTAKVQPSEVDKYIEMGATGVIAKPFDPMELAETIKGYWSEFNAQQ